MDGIEIMQLMAFSVLFGYVFAMLCETDAESPLYSRYARPVGMQKKIKPTYLILLLVVVGSITFARDVIVGCTPFGTTTIGGTLEKGDYVEDYYVFAFEGASESLNYRVKARIHSYSKLEGMEMLRRYEVERIQLLDGTYATFDAKARSGYSLEPDRRIMVRDDNGKSWGIQLTREKALK